MGSSGIDRIRETEPEEALRWRPAMAWLAPLTAMVMPGRTARRLDHVGMFRAWLVHLISAEVVFFAAFAIEALHRMGFRESVWNYPDKLWEAVVGHVMSFTYYSPEEAGFAVVVYVLTIETGLILLAWFLMPWGARDETYNQSLRRAMVRVWLISSFVATPIVVIGVLTRCIDWLDYVIDTDWGPIRWLLRYEVAHLGVWVIVINAAIALLLQAMASGPWRARCRWPACCEGCGYSLMGMRMGQSCPECGMAVDDTLDPRRRPGSPLQSHGWTLMALLRCTLLPIFRPKMFGERLQSMSPTNTHRWFMLYSTLLSMIVAAIGCVFIMGLSVAYDDYFDGIGEFVAEVAGVTLAAWLTYICIAPLIVLGAAALVGSSARTFLKRNLMTVAMQGSCYLSGLLVVWTGVICAWVGGIISLIDWLEELSYYNPNYDLVMMVIPLSFIVINLLMLLTYLFLLGRITWAAAHANR